MKSRGFTFVEVLAAVALFAVMSVGIASVIRETARVTNKVKIRQTSVQSAQLAVDRLTREISLAYDEGVQKALTTFNAKETTKGPELMFTYLDSSIRTLFQKRTPGVKIVGYYLEAAKDGTFNLVRTEAPITLAEKFEEDGLFQNVVVARGIMSWKLEMYDPRTDQWKPTWNFQDPSSGGYFPSAVKINLEVVDPELPSDQRKERSLMYQTSILLLNEFHVANRTSSNQGSQQERIREGLQSGQ